MDRSVILLAAHGERGGAANNERLAACVASVAAEMPECDVGSVLVNLPGVAQRALAACGDRPVIVLPLLFSDGFFFRERLAPCIIGSRQRLARPLALWPSFGRFLADNLAHRLIDRRQDPRVVLVAHGSGKSSHSADSARKVADAMQAHYGRVEVGFLEQEPFARDVVGRTDAPYAMIGLFFGAGLHGGEDFDILAASAPHAPEAAFTVGDLPGVSGLLAGEARRLLAEIEAS